MSTSFRSYLRKLAMDIGIKPKHQDYVKFILLGRSRTGSNFVRGLLNSHEQIIAFGELFKTTQTVEWSLEGYPTSGQALELLQTAPAAFMDQVLFGKYPRQIGAVGFKLFYYHAQKDGLEEIWPHLQARTDIRVLHIKRRNILRTHLSRERAVRTDRWANVTGEREKEPPIALKYEDCLQDFIQTRQWEEEYDRFFANHQMLNVVYEELLANFDQQVSLIQDFLEVRRKKLESDTHKQSHQSLSESIANFDELKEKFAGTQWEAFFTGDE